MLKQVHDAISKMMDCIININKNGDGNNNNRKS